MSDARERLDSWKAIAAYLNRDVRTVRRWETAEGLPVHRHVHAKKGTVYAYRAEIDAWLATRKDNSSPLNGIPSAREWTGWQGHVGSRACHWSSTVGRLDVVGDPQRVFGNSTRFQRARLGAHYRLREPDRRFIVRRMVEYALERELSNSPFVNVVPAERVQDTLRLMRLPLDSPIEAALGREIAQRDGEVRVLLAGRVEVIDSTYLLSVQLIGPREGAAVAATSKEAKGEAEVLPTLRVLSDWTRETLGEKLTVAAAPDRRLEKVTTPSLSALKLYSQAVELTHAPREWPVIEQLLRQAVQEDPDFATAHIYLAHAIRNQGKPLEEYMPYADRAARLAPGTSDSERHFILGSFHALKGRYEEALTAFRTHLEFAPDDYWGRNNLAAMYRALDRRSEAAVSFARVADLRPNDFSLNAQASGSLARKNLLGLAREYNRQALELLRDMPATGNPLKADVELFSAWGYLQHGDPRSALGEANRLRKKLASLNNRQKLLYVHPLGKLYLTIGKLRQAEDLYEDAEVWNLSTEVKYSFDSHRIAAGFSRTGRFLESFDESQIELTLVVPVVLARLGRTSRADRSMSQVRTDFATLVTEDLLSIYSGELALARGRTAEAARLLQEGLEVSKQRRGPETHFLAAESLAMLFEQRGDTGRAARLLEDWSGPEARAWVFYSNGRPTSPYWISTRFKLAALYRRMGRDDQAAAIESELRDLLALADADHNIAMELQQLANLAKQTAPVNE